MSLRERRNSTEPSLPQYIPGTPMKDVFLETFLDWFDSPPMRALARVSYSSPILCNALQAVSTMCFGVSVGDLRIVFSAQKLYGDVLRNLRRAFSSSSESKSEWTLYTVVLAGYFEVTWSQAVASGNSS